jgi:hypothetical protein
LFVRTKPRSRSSATTPASSRSRSRTHNPDKSMTATVHFFPPEVSPLRNSTAHPSLINRPITVVTPTRHRWHGNPASRASGPNATDTFLRTTLNPLCLRQVLPAVAHPMPALVTSVAVAYHGDFLGGLRLGVHAASRAVDLGALVNLRHGVRPLVLHLLETQAFAGSFHAFPKRNSTAFRSRSASLSTPSSRFSQREIVSRSLRRARPEPSRRAA